MAHFNFELDKLKSKLVELKPKKVLVQLPEGIKQHASMIQKVIKDLGIETIFSGETCWGGCSIATTEAKEIKADLIVHFGHAKFIDGDFPILYIEIKDEVNLTPLLEKSLEQLKNYKNLGLSFSVQHRHDQEKITSFYNEHNKKVIVSEKKGYAAYPGHVIGCEFQGLKTIQEKVDAFIVVGNNFHSMGAVKKPVFLIDVYNNTVTEMLGVRDKILRQRIVAIDKAKQAKTFGIIQEIKPGQKFGSPSFLKEKLEAAGKDVVIISMSEISPDKLMNFYHIDAFVELACPRIAIDDFAKYEKPLITQKEALVVVGDKTIDGLLEKGFI